MVTLTLTATNGPNATGWALRAIGRRAVFRPIDVRGQPVRLIVRPGAVVHLEAATEALNRLGAVAVHVDEVTGPPTAA